MKFIMDMNEQVFLLFDCAMGFHCNREKKEKMPFRCFKKIIELNSNSFLIHMGAGLAFPVEQ